MKSRILLLGACALLAGGGGRAHAQTANQDHLHSYKTTPVWSDDFNGSAVSPDNWAFETGNNNGWGNNEKEYYQTGGANTSVANGELTITARKEFVGGFNYTSARMLSKGLQDVRFGRVEACINLPQGQGLWPGFWMMGSNIDEPNTHWPRCGEIDIVERVNFDNRAYATEHWHDPSSTTDTQNPGRVQYGTTYAMPTPGGYHTYAMEWDENFIYTWVDNVKYHEFDIRGGVHSTEEFQNGFLCC